MKIRNSYSFLVIGKTQESTEATEGFKRYVGVGSTFVKGVQPTKKEIDEFFGYESQSEPEYIKDTDNGKEVRITFLLQTDPAANNGIELKSRAHFTLRMAPDYSKDQTKVRVIDSYGNYSIYVDAEDAKAGKPILTSKGNPSKLDTKYRIAFVGECDLVDFLKKYLCVPDAFSYVNGAWVKNDNADNLKFGFTPDDIKKLFTGDFKDLKDAIALQPNNRIKLLYGVQTNSEGKQFQNVCTRGNLILSNSSKATALEKMRADLAKAKQNGLYANIDYRVQELQEYSVAPTNLETPVDDSNLPFDGPSSSEMPWD